MACGCVFVCVLFLRALVPTFVLTRRSLCVFFLQSDVCVAPGVAAGGRAGSQGWPSNHFGHTQAALAKQGMLRSVRLCFFSCVFFFHFRAVHTFLWSNLGACAAKPTAAKEHICAPTTHSGAERGRGRRAGNETERGEETFEFRAGKTHAHTHTDTHTS